MSNDNRNKNTRGHITAFYIETLFLAVIFVIMILVLIQVFAFSVRMSDSAKELNNAVQLAENAAEAVAASDSPQELVSLLDENGNTQIQQDGRICAEYDREMKPYPGGAVQVEITWEPDGEGCVYSAIAVCRKGEAEPVYNLTTAVHVKEAVP